VRFLIISHLKYAEIGITEARPTDFSAPESAASIAEVGKGIAEGFKGYHNIPDPAQIERRTG
jgi:hypothetical protein